MNGKERKKQIREIIERKAQIDKHIKEAFEVVERANNNVAQTSYGVGTITVGTLAARKPRKYKRKLTGEILDEREMKWYRNTLIKIGTAQTLGELVEYLLDPDPGIRETAQDRARKLKEDAEK